MARIEGIDVSHWNPLETIAENLPEFVFIKLTEGKTYDGVKIQGDWTVHDGVVPLASALYPQCDKDTATDYKNALAKGQKIKKGRWYYMDTLEGMDHFDFCGTKDYPTAFEDFYFSIIENVNSR